MLTLKYKFIIVNKLYIKFKLKKLQHFYILGIETSCDETGIAVYSSMNNILSNEIFSQIKIHKKFGGVIPEIAAREHIKKFMPTFNKAIEKSNININLISAIAYTAGPGLVGSLLVGSAFAKTLSYVLNIPSIPINHLEGHILICKMEYPNIKYPFLSLIISGGHTQIVIVYDIGIYKIIADTLDDAVGEVFDKVAKMMNLGYPGGPEISKIAKKSKQLFDLTIPMKKNKKLYFSFSGLKTQIRKLYENSDKTDQIKSDIAFSFEKIVVETLILKIKLASEIYKINQIAIVGGVASNTRLRNEIKLDNHLRNIDVFFPKKIYCTDNGAMIAYCGYLKFMQKKIYSNQIKIFTQWNLDAKL